MGLKNIKNGRIFQTYNIVTQYETINGKTENVVCELEFPFYKISSVFMNIDGGARIRLKKYNPKTKKLIKNENGGFSSTIVSPEQFSNQFYNEYDTNKLVDRFTDIIIKRKCSKGGMLFLIPNQRFQELDCKLEVTKILYNRYPEKFV